MSWVRAGDGIDSVPCVFLRLAKPSLTLLFPSGTIKDTSKGT